MAEQLNQQAQSTIRDAPIVTVTDVSVSFGERGRLTPVTHGVGFVLRRGETLSLVGESGSGKSVTAMAIPGLLPGNARLSGSITFRGTELVGASRATLERIRGSGIGVVFQEPMTALNPVYTVGTMLAQALRSHGMRSKAEIRRESLRLLGIVGIPEPERRIRQYPHQLSGGLRQRAMIAIAISGRPEVLIADEPTTALDVTVQQEILTLLKDLQARFSMAIIFITHDMGVVADVADRVCVMRSGRIVEEGNVFQVFEKPATGYTRELLAAVPRLGSGGSPVATPEHAEDVLELVGLTVRYPGRLGRPGFVAVRDVSLSIPCGSILGLVGESGSGKSTIGKAVVGLAAAAGGRIVIEGLDVVGVSAAAARRARFGVATVFQDPASSLNPRFTIGESIVEPLRQRKAGNRRQLRQRAGELLDLVRLPSSWAGRYPHELSGGQRQRVGIARAIGISPKLLIADEPTSALDVSVQATILDLFRELQRDFGFSCLFISHDLAVVEMLADYVAVLQQGELVEVGTAVEILRNPRQDYTRRLIAAAPVPDPRIQKNREPAAAGRIIGES